MPQPSRPPWPPPYQGWIPQQTSLGCLLNQALRAHGVNSNVRVSSDPDLGAEREFLEGKGCVLGQGRGRQACAACFPAPKSSRLAQQ